MSERFGPFGLSKEDEDQRLMNLDAVKRFMALRGRERKEGRDAIYDETGSQKDLLFCGPDYKTGGRVVKQHNHADAAAAQQVIDKFPDWGFFDVHVYSTDDPYVVFAEADGRGMKYDMSRWDYAMYYQNHFLFKFILKDGKVRIHREIYNPFMVMNTSGEVVPPIF